VIRRLLWIFSVTLVLLFVCSRSLLLTSNGLELVWREKARLGWTADRYGRTSVWRNTREWTTTAVPALFQCGPDRRSNCAE
jgi:hypothetical protein